MNNELKQQKQQIFNEATLKSSRFRSTIENDSMTNKQRISEAAKIRSDITKAIKEAEKEINSSNKLFDEQKKKVKALQEEMKKAHGELKKQLQEEVQQEKQLQHQLQLKKELAAAALRSNELAKDSVDLILAENKGVDKLLSMEDEIVKKKEKDVKLDRERKELAEELEESAKQYDKYSLANLNTKKETYKQQQKELNVLEKEYNKLSEEDRKTARGRALHSKIDGLRQTLNTTNNDINDIYNGMTSGDKSKAIESLSESFKSGLESGFYVLSKKLDPIVEAVNLTRNTFNGFVNNAANTVSQYYGPITAALEGVTGDIKDFKTLNSKLRWDVGLSSMVEQTKVLSNISQLVNQGITSDVESLGILKSINDKTIASFDVANGDLRRLVRLNQQRGNLTAKQFGLADALKESFNSTFGDTSFLNAMFQNITGTVLDAVSANAQGGGTDSTAFYSVLESWLGAMYESGVDSGTVSSIAQGINYLGSGNISALSGNKQLQSLLLLSMDRAGLDYASVLQQGLSNGDMNKLLSTVVDYLAEITSNTKDNNVLQSSYAQLFNMSITDMTAIQNLSKSNYSALSMSGNGALAQALGEINKVGSRTSVAEKIDNVINNATYSFGSSIAESALAYSTYRISNLVLDSIDGVGQMVAGDRHGILKKGLGVVYDAISGPARTVASITYMTSLLPGMLGLGTSLMGSLSSFNGDGLNGLAEVVAKGNNGGIYDGSSAASAVMSISRGISNVNDTLKQFSLSSTSAASGISDTSTWENDVKAASEDDDANTKILKEFEKTLMKAKEGDGYAFAVSLQGMSDGVLRSFASIFADEDAMLNTMTGKNNALEKNNTFIDYVESNETKTNSSTKK